MYRTLRHDEAERTSPDDRCHRILFIYRSYGKRAFDGLIEILEKLTTNTRTPGWICLDDRLSIGEDRSVLSTASDVYAIAPLVSLGHDLQSRRHFQRRRLICNWERSN